MKKALGEANLTVIVITMVGIIAAIGIPLIIRSKDKIKEQSCCNNYGGVWNNGACSVDIKNTDCMKE